MTVRVAFKVLVFSIALLSIPASAQDSPAEAPGRSSCGKPDIQFEVKPSSGQTPAQPDAGKALVYFIEKDSNISILKPITRAGLDGTWVGATHGNSYFYFSVDPGVHHLCANTQFSGIYGHDQTAFFHFTAEAGSVYYFEMNNISLHGQTNSTDASLLPLDSDEGKFLASIFSLVTSHEKK